MRFGREVSSNPKVRFISSQELDEVSAASERLDLQSALSTGFPYKIPHADHLAALFAAASNQQTPKKGLITDLDDTLWAGIVGEVGVEGVGWTLNEDAQIHGLYQQLLSSLSSAGVMVAVASKNNPQIVEEAFERGDLILKRRSVFPVAAGWGAKSKSVESILKAWNIGADAVVFVDDSPLELAEVKAAFPAIECLQFRKDKPDEVWRMLFRLRDLFGKPQVLEEDKIRLESLRTVALHKASAPARGGGGRIRSQYCADSKCCSRIQVSAEWDRPRI